ncbi:LLM class flavin-dependent oxidoreductase [Mycobacterium syngnathidarum]
MKISLFAEVPIINPTDENAELEAFTNLLDQSALADELGYHAIWATEHHFLEEYCHSTAPEVLLAAIAGRTKNIRLGMGIKHMPPQINHPARVAEQLATLDLVSGGRVEWGTGEGSSVAELGGFNVDPGRKREMYVEAMHVALRCMTETPFRGHEGEFVSMPPRNVIPKPTQKPHPPMWVGCTRPSTVELAGRWGIGALNFASANVEVMAKRMKAYMDAFAEAVPLTPTVNVKFAVPVGDMMCASTTELARKRLGHSEGFLGSGIAHYYSPDSMHMPAKTRVWPKHVAAREAMAKSNVTQSASLAGDPKFLREAMLQWESLGIDEAWFILPPVEHEYIMESLDMFGRQVLPEFIERDEKLTAQREKELAPLVDAALRRYKPMEIEYDEDYQFGGIPKAFTGTYEASEIADVIQAMMKNADIEE